MSDRSTRDPDETSTAIASVSGGVVGNGYATGLAAGTQTEFIRERLIRSCCILIASMTLADQNVGKGKEWTPEVGLSIARLTPNKWHATRGSEAVLWESSRERCKKRKQGRGCGG